MKYLSDEFNYLIRLEKGEFLTEQLIKFMNEKQIKGAWVSGIGGAAWAELGFYDLGQKNYQWKKVGTALEIINLQGNLTWSDGVPAPHFHGTFSDQEMKTYSGHLKELEVSGTCELFVHVWDGNRLTRGRDEATGLKLLDL